MELLQRYSSDLSEIDLTLLSDGVIPVSTESLAQLCGDKGYCDPQWQLLAGRLLMHNIHSKAPEKFSIATKMMAMLLDRDYFEFVISNAEKLDTIIDPKRDLVYNAFSVKTFEQSYLTKINGNIIETPQYVFLRVAVYLHYPNLEDIELMYNRLSRADYMHASPTLFNSGMIKHQLASCFLSTIGDSMQGLTKGWKDFAFISMNSGALGEDYSQIRHSSIAQRGNSSGVIPWMKITDNVLRAVNQGGKRKGAECAYLRDWHIDIFEFLEMRTDGPEEMRVKDMVHGVMISDLFMKRVKANEEWSLFCPNIAKGLSELWGKRFEDAYIEAENKKLYKRKVMARDLWNHLLIIEMKTSMPFMLYMDPCNRKSNQQHSGVIKCSNLCTEILEVTSNEEIASCILASISLNKCVKKVGGVAFFDFELLAALTRELVRNLNKVIDRNYYPPEVPEIAFSQLRHRPLGIGVQGFANAIAEMDMSWVVREEKGDGISSSTQVLALNPKLKQLNRDIFETMYYSAIDESSILASKEGSYPSFKDSPSSRGYFQFDLWDLENKGLEFNQIPITNDHLHFTYPGSSGTEISRYGVEHWDELRNKMKRGMRNSLLISLMPTASTAHLIGHSESFEPLKILSSRTVLSGQFMVISDQMIKDLKEIDMWTTETLQSIINNNESIQNLTTNNKLVANRLEAIKLKYLNSFELPWNVPLELAVDRAKYVCQSQSLNCFMGKPTKNSLTKYHFAAWKAGLKTGMYYLRQQALVDPINFTSITIPGAKPVRKNKVCTDDVCYSCQG